MTLNEESSVGLRKVEIMGCVSLLNSEIGSWAIWTLIILVKFI